MTKPSPQALTERVGEGLIWQPTSCNLPNQLFNHKDLHCLARTHHLCEIAGTPCISSDSMVCLHASLQTHSLYQITEQKILCSEPQLVKNWNVTNHVALSPLFVVLFLIVHISLRWPCTNLMPHGPVQTSRGVLSKDCVEVMLRTYDVVRSSWTSIRRSFLASDRTRTGSVSVQDFRKVRSTIVRSPHPLTPCTSTHALLSNTGR